MPKQIHEWSLTEVDNGFSPADGGMPELMARSDVNNSARARMAALRSYYDDPEWVLPQIRGPLASDVATFARTSSTQFTLTFPSAPVSGADLTPYFPPGRILKVVDGDGAGTDAIVKVGTSSFDGSTRTTVNVAAPASIDAASSGVFAYFSKSARLLIFEDAAEQFYVPATNDAAGIQAAINQALADGGGTVFLKAPLYIIGTTITIPISSGSISVRLWGGSTGAELRRQTSTALDEMLVSQLGTFGEGNLSIEGVTFNPQVAGAGGGDKDSLSITGTGRVLLRDCFFLNARRSVSFTANVLNRGISVQGCVFSGHTEAAVWARSGTGTPDGKINGCNFSKSSNPSANGADIDVSGFWTIVGNRFENVGSTSTTTRGIRLEPKVTASTGGRRSTITGNVLAGGSGALGTMIEVGGSHVVVSGNQITNSPSGTGILVFGSSGGNPINSVSVVGNLIEGGAVGISCNELVERAIVSGNQVLNVSGNGVSVRSTGAKVSGNLIRSALNGVVAGINGNGISISDNRIDSASARGVFVSGSTQDIRVSRNDIVGTGYSVAMVVADAGAGLDAVTDNALVAPGVTALSFPSPIGTVVLGNEGAGPNFNLTDLSWGSLSVRRSQGEVVVGTSGSWGHSGGNIIVSIGLTVDVTNFSIGAQVLTMRVRIGPSGTVSDQLVADAAFLSDIVKTSRAIHATALAINNNDVVTVTAQTAAQNRGDTFSLSGSLTLAVIGSN